MDDVKSCLESLGFCHDLPDAVVAQLAGLASTRDYPAGEALFFEGAVNTDLMFIVSGKIRLQMRVLGRGSSPFLTLGPRQLVAWSAVLGAGVMSAAAVAVEPTTVLAIPADKILEVCEQDHHFGYRFMQQLARALADRLVATRLQLLDLFHHDAPHIDLVEAD